MIRYNLERQFTVRCSNKLHEDVERCAESKGQTVQEWIRRSMQDAVDKQLSEDNKDSLLDNIRAIFYEPEFREYLRSILVTEKECEKTDLKYAVSVKDEIKSALKDPEFKKYLKNNILKDE